MVSITVAEVLLAYERSLKPLDSERDSVRVSSEVDEKDIAQINPLDLANMFNSKAPFYVLLNNDDVHTYDEVKKVLTTPPLAFSTAQSEEQTVKVN